MNDLRHQEMKMKWVLITAVGVLLAVVCAFLPGAAQTAYGFTATSGTVIDGPVLVRSAPVNGAKITTLNPGAVVTVTDEVDQTDTHGTSFR